MKSPDYDIAIVGGGVVGSTLAVALSEARFKVALIEARKPAEFDPNGPYALRQSAVGPAQANLLRNTGLWSFIEQRACPFMGMKVWEQGSQSEVFFEHTELGIPELGHIVDNELMVASAWRELKRVDVYCPAKFESLSIGENSATLTLDTGKHMTASLVVGAEGARSFVREAAGIDTFGWPYHQRCTVGAISTEKHHQNIAWQRYIESGPVAFLPLQDGRCSLAWHADEQVANELAQLSEAQFCKRLTQASGGVLGKVTAIERRASFPLKLQNAKQYVAQRVALVGDAAHVVHPMVGQGINLGLLDVAELAEQLEQERDAGLAPGTQKYLRRYQRNRMADSLMMLGAADACKRMYGTQNPLVKWVRSKSLDLTAGFAPIRQLMIHHATGLDHKQQRLLRGLF